jgi:hypothetical protein
MGDPFWARTCSSGSYFATRYTCRYDRASVGTRSGK